MFLAIGIGAVVGATLTLLLIAWLMPEDPESDGQISVPETSDDF